MAWDKQVRADKIRLAALKQTTNFVFMVQKSIADFDFFECKKPYKQGYTPLAYRASCVGSYWACKGCVATNFEKNKRGYAL